GKILVGGLNLRQIDLPAWRRNVAYLSQRPYVPERCTVYEVMRLTRPGLTEVEACEGLDRMSSLGELGRGPQPVLSTRMASLSVGIAQRVMLARALARPASLILLDEPDENLDSSASAALRDLIGGLVPRHMVAVATHD